MKRTDFLVVTGPEKMVITYKKAVKIEIHNLEEIPRSQRLGHFIKMQRKANKIINEIIKGESEFLFAQSLCHALANQN